MRRTHRHFSVLVLSAALTISLAGLSPASAEHDEGNRPAGPRAVGQGPGIGSSSGTPHARALTTYAGNSRSARAVRSPWPTKQVKAVTVEDTAIDPAASPAQQLGSATLTQNVVRGTFNAKVRLRGTPSATKDSWVLIAFGRLDADGYTCRAIGTEEMSVVYWSAYGESVPHLVRRGAYMELQNYSSPTAKKDRFNCAFAETWEILPEGAPEDQQAILYSGRSDYSLARRYDTPQFSIKAPKRVSAKVNRSTIVKVTVKNKNSRVTARAVKVTIQGNKISSRTVKLGKLRPGKTATAKVRFRAARGATATPKIVVRSLNVKKTKKLRIR